MSFRIISGLFILFMGATFFFDWTKSKLRFIIKKGIDCIMPPFFYTVLLCGWNESGNDKLLMNIMSIVAVISLVGLFISQMIIWNKSHGVSKIHFVFAIINIFISICVSFSLLNFLIYINFPYMFEIPATTSIFELGFEFLYYTFMLMLTYSDSSIGVVHICAKLLQMIEISAFYVTIGIYIADLVERYKTINGTKVVN